MSPGFSPSKPDPDAQSSATFFNQNQHSIGLLVVHGIGKQKPGETLDGIVDGLKLLYEDNVNCRRISPNHALLQTDGRQVHIFEVYWADLLHGETVKGTFNFDRIFETVWFPLLNYRNGLLSKDIYSKYYVYGWTGLLAPISSFLSLGYYGAQMIAAAISGVAREKKRADERRTFIRSGVNAREIIQTYKKDKSGTRTVLDDVMDQVAGDVFNYVHGAANAFPDETEQNQELAHNVKRIHRNFFDVVSQAKEVGCNELQVLSHSLGTVIAYRSICMENDELSQSENPIQLTNFYTIGSPLEKIRFFWPKLIEVPKTEPDVTIDESTAVNGSMKSSGYAMKWHNFYNRLDLVSGHLLPFKQWPVPTNYKALGLGGLISSHVSYNNNPLFLTLIGKELFQIEPHEMLISPLRRFWNFMITGAENLILPAVLSLLAAFGFFIMIGIGWITGSILTIPLEWMGFESLANGVKYYFLFVMIIGATIIPVYTGYRSALRFHDLHWKS